MDAKRKGILITVVSAVMILCIAAVLLLGGRGGNNVNTSLNTANTGHSGSTQGTASQNTGEQISAEIRAVEPEENKPSGSAETLVIKGGGTLNVFLSGEEADFQVLTDIRTDKAVDVEFALIDTFGERTLYSGTSRIEENESGFEVVFKGLQLGHYKLTASAKGTEIKNAAEYAAVIPQPSERGAASDSFALDLASIWHSTREQRRDYLDLISKLGVNKVRERIKLSDIYNPDGEPNMTKYIRGIEEIKEAGMDVIITFHDVPDALKGDSGKTLDCDLLAVYNLIKSAVEALGDNITAWELWNEEDVIFFSYAAPDEFAAFAKACALAVQDSGVETYKALGSYARGPYDSIFGEWMMRNDIMKYHDIYNFHSYVFAPNLYNPIFLDEKVVAEHMENAAKYAEGKAVWQTETGVMMYGGETENRPAAGLYQQARYVAVSSVQSAAMGVERTYQYIMIPLGSGGDSCSFISNYGTPYPAFSSYSTMTYLLGKAEFKGKMNSDICSGYVFDSGDGEVSMLWTEGGQKEVRIKTDRPVSVYSMMGDSEIISPQNGEITITVSSYPCYIKGVMDKDLYAAFDPGTNKASVNQIAQGDRMVLRPIFPDANLPFFPDRGSVAENYEGIQTGYQFKAGETVKVRLEIYNFDAENKNGRISLSVPEGFRADRTEFEVNIEAYSKAVIEFNITEGGAQADTLYDLSYSGSFGGVQTSACVSRLQLRG